MSRESFSSSKVCALLELATPRHRNAPPLLRLVCLPRFLPSDDAFTPIGLACAPYAVSRCSVPKHHRRRLWGPHAVALHHIFRWGGYSSSGFNSSPEFHPCTAAVIGFPAGEPADKRVVRSFRGFSPLQRFPSRAEPPIPGGFPTHRFVLRPQGFAPSRRFAPRSASRACFIPVPLLGFGSSRLFSARDAVRRFRRRAPPGVPYLLRRAGPPLQGFSTSREARPRYPGFSQATVSNASTSFIPFEVSCLRRSAGRYARHLPSRAFSARSSR